MDQLIDFTMNESGPMTLYEPDPRYVELLLGHLEFDGTKSKGVSTPGEKSGMYHDETELEKSKVTLCRSCVMRFAYLSADLLHLQFCASRLARGMSKPMAAHWSRLKITARYLKTHGRWPQDYRRQASVNMIDIFTDSDWASDRTDRKSVSW